MSYATKLRLADGLEILLKNNSISKITVSAIVRTSKVSRQAFYNNFSDIYDLLFWIHEVRTQDAIDTFWQEEDFRQAFCTSLTVMKSHKAFYQQIVRKEGENSFQNSFKSQNIALSRVRIRNVSGNDPDAATDFLLTLYWNGATQMLVDWILNGMKEEPRELSALFYDALPLPLRQYWIK